MSKRATKQATNKGGARAIFTERIVTRVSSRVRENLERIAAERGRPLSEISRTALEEYEPEAGR